jgi:hypothetical protein
MDHPIKSVKSGQIALHPELNGARACIFDAGGTLVHPDWPRLSTIAAEVANSTFLPKELKRAFGTMLRKVGMEMQREGNVPAEEMKRPHWTFKTCTVSLGWTRQSAQMLWHT